ncbi:MAG: hypothetical protein U0T72_02060 [Chitinophagales bacterium]
MNTCEYSAYETKYLGLKFARYNTNCIDADYLNHTLYSEQYDVIRIRTSATDNWANIKLNSLKYPFFFHGGIRRYTVNCFEVPPPQFTHANISFELYTTQNKHILQSLFSVCIQEEPIGYCRTPLLQNIISKETETNCLSEFYCHLYNNREYASNYLWLMKADENYIGFVALTVYDDVLKVDASLAGVIPTYQNKGLFPNIIRQVRKFCIENNLPNFTCGARLNNMYSQWAFEKEYMKCEETQYVYHLVPLLSFNQGQH